MLNGCVLVLRLSDFNRRLVDQVIASVVETYTPEGVRIWWHHWLKQDDRARWLEKALSYGGPGGDVTAALHETPAAGCAPVHPVAGPGEAGRAGGEAARASTARPVLPTALFFVSRPRNYRGVVPPRGSVAS